MPLVSSRRSGLLKAPNNASILHTIGSFMSSVYRVIVDAALRTSHQVRRGCSSTVFASWSNHSSSAGEIVSLQSNFAFNSSLQALICFEIFARPFLRELIGFGAMVEVF